MIDFDAKLIPVSLNSPHPPSHTHTPNFMPGMWELVFPTVLVNWSAFVALWS